MDAMSTPDAIVSLLPKKGFEIADIHAYIQSKQNIRNGKSLLAGGFLRGITASTSVGARHSKLRAEGYVEAELKARVFYKTKLKVEDKGWAATCTCQARAHQTKCKHQAGFLFMLLCFRDYKDCTSYPQEFKRKGVGRLQLSN
tara:strand:+ start:172 stop:600 length:429 start_codon:yes stop_codon:yes gene_type:complete